MAEIDGARLVARCLKQQGIDELFGVVGVPVTGIAIAAPSEGIRYVGMRHEQAAGYAAQAILYRGLWPGNDQCHFGAGECLGQLLADAAHWRLVEPVPQSHGGFSGCTASGLSEALLQMGRTGGTD